MTEAKPRSPFPSTFWVANVMELFERGAYYGMNSVLAIYLAGPVAEGGLGFGEQSVGSSPHVHTSTCRSWAAPSPTATATVGGFSSPFPSSPPAISPPATFRPTVSSSSPCS